MYFCNRVSCPVHMPSLFDISKIATIKENYVFSESHSNSPVTVKTGFCCARFTRFFLFFRIFLICLNSQGAFSPSFKIYSVFRLSPCRFILRNPLLYTSGGDRGYHHSGASVPHAGGGQRQRNRCQFSHRQQRNLCSGEQQQQDAGQDSRWWTKRRQGETI